MIGAYALAKLGKAIDPNDSICHAYWLELMAVGKQAQYPFPYVISNEFISSVLGTFLGLPLPPYAILQSKGSVPSYWFSSLDFRLTGESLPPIDPEDCVSKFPDISTGLVVFDAWIANSDRHEKNINLDMPHGKPPRINIFDHSHALFGTAQKGQGLNHIAAIREEFIIDDDSLGNRHCLLDHLSSDNYFPKWIDRVQAAPNFLIEDAAKNMVELGLLLSEEAQGVVDFLVYRRDNIDKIVKENLAAFKAVKTPTTFWCQK